MRVNLRGLDIRVAEQFLKNTNVHPIFEHLRRKAVAQRTAADFSANPGFLCGPLGRFPQRGFKNVMTHIPC